MLIGYVPVVGGEGSVEDSLLRLQSFGQAQLMRGIRSILYGQHSLNMSEWIDK